MTYKPALEADARLAAKNALKIRAALAQSFDARWVYDNYLKTNPIKSGNLAQDRARARAWVMLNVLVNMETLKEVMMRVWAEGYVTGEAFADEQLRFARERNKATDTDIDWANWKPGDRAAALLLRPPDAFKKLLASQGITFKELSDTTIRDIGNAVGEAIELGLPAQRSAKRIKDHVASASRALSIAITEQNRAISFATVNRYKEAGLEKMEWEVSSPCDKCAQNANQVVAIGGTFNSGATQPPQHPHCRCVLLPVLPDFDDPAYTGGNINIPAAPVTPVERIIEATTARSGGFVPGQWSKLEKEQIRKEYEDKIRERYANNEAFMNILIKQPDKATKALIEKGVIYRNGNIEVQFYSGGASVSEKTKQAIVEHIERLQLSNGKEKLTVTIGSSKKGAYGWAISGGNQIWIAPSTVKMKTPNPLEWQSGHKMPVLQNMNQWEYTLAHEWGHHIDINDLQAQKRAMQTLAINKLKNEFPDAFVSKYATTNEKEFFAEMFAEWFGTAGTTANPLVQAMAKEFGWKA
jgi:hypothetical protein